MVLSKGLAVIYAVLVKGRHFSELLYQTRDLASLHDNQHRQILAVPMGETELLQIHQEFFRELVANGDARAIALVETWLLQLGSVFSHVTMPTIQVKAEGQSRFSLIDAQTFQPEAGVTCWVKLTQGTVRFLGFEELTLTPATATFPLSDRMWLEAVEGVQLTTKTTSALENSDTLLAGLSQLHTQILQCTYLLDELEAQAEMMRLAVAQRLNRQVTAQAIGELASTLSSQDGGLFSGRYSFVGCCWCGRKGYGCKNLPPISL